MWASPCKCNNLSDSNDLKKLMTRLIQHRTIMRCLRSGGVNKQTEEKGENRISPFSFLLFHFVLLRWRRSSAGDWRQNWFERPGARFFNWHLFFAAAGRSSSLGIFDRQSRNDASDLHAIKRFVFEQNLSHEPPYTEPFVRWCGRTAAVTRPPTRSKDLVTRRSL